MMSSNKLFSLKKQKIPPKTIDIPYISPETCNQCLDKSRLHIKSAKAEPLKYLIMIEHYTVVIPNPEPC